MSRREVTGYQWSAPTASAGQSAKRVKRGTPFLAAFARSGSFDSTPQKNHVETAARGCPSSLCGDGHSCPSSQAKLDSLFASSFPNLLPLRFQPTERTAPSPPQETSPDC